MSKENILEVKESEVFKDLIIEIKNEMHEKYVETQNSNISFEDFVENFYFHVGYVLRKKIACAGQMLMSRSKARETVDMEEYKKSMSGIYTTSVNECTLDEAPMAYKSLEDIIDVVSESVNIVEVMKPVFNFKAS